MKPCWVWILNTSLLFTESKSLIYISKQSAQHQDTSTAPCPFTLTCNSKLLVGRLGLPKNPSESNAQLEKRGNPKSTSKPDPGLGQETTTNSTKEKKNGSNSPSVTISVVGDGCGKKLCVAHHIAVQACQHNRGHRVVLEGSTGNNLASTLECEDGDSGVVRCWEGVLHPFDNPITFVGGASTVGVVPHGACSSEESDQTREHSLDEE